uniref:Uncharacterized protein n=1 Tax=Anguilla anguilla TaxID=7936 RepID=A0A0E9QYC4_ANGAN
MTANSVPQRPPMTDGSLTCLQARLYMEMTAGMLL